MNIENKEKLFNSKLIIYSFLTTIELIKGPCLLSKKE